MFISEQLILYMLKTGNSFRVCVYMRIVIQYKITNKTNIKGNEDEAESKDGGERGNYVIQSIQYVVQPLGKRDPGRIRKVLVVIIMGRRA